MLVALHDPLLVLASFAAVLLLVLGARAVGSHSGSGTVMRRGIHAAIGIWSAFVATRFHTLGWALVPPIAFLALNASGRTERLAPSLARPGESGGSRGLWTFPLGVALTYALFWKDAGRAPVVAGCLVLALADPVAAWIGTRWGQRRLRPLRLRRTLEGSIAFFLVAALVVGFVAARNTEGIPVVRLAIACAAAGTLIEALAPAGWDNAAIPLAVAAAYHALAGS